MFIVNIHRPPSPTLIPYTTLFRSNKPQADQQSKADTERERPAKQDTKSDGGDQQGDQGGQNRGGNAGDDDGDGRDRRSEEHTSELQSHSDLVCRLLLEKKKEIRMK